MKTGVLRKVQDSPESCHFCPDEEHSLWDCTSADERYATAEKATFTFDQGELEFQEANTPNEEDRSEDPMESREPLGYSSIGISSLFFFSLLLNCRISEAL
ncbi:hypothetical protein TRV_03080 [Trichophyton verrucosum HKI 0517]|uniref:Uncharacterized protein n=1 Tax=Trichophyton verrucosum (strain HKI 0517) TaxID=663202 RepID=D4D7J8_TRIVH|nr:uncharacterized protein TRV_03080 [Trichophyton verrucosum HKI 0517]EFE42166.1 hypothetical protein TRV_03080 [Trichophyton verrucosum HKI 0517]